MASIRGIPDVTVELVEDMKIRAHNEVNTWDSMRKIFNGYAVLVGSTEDKEEQITRDQFGNNFTSNTEKKEGIPLTMRRVWRVSKGSLGATTSDLVMLGSYVILRPNAPIDTYHARLAPLQEGETEHNYSGNDVKNQGRRWERSGEILEDRVTTSSWFEKAGQTWIPVKDAIQGRIFELHESQEQESPNQRIQFAASAEGLMCPLESQFVLRKNQPFAVQINFGNWAEKTKSEVSTVLQREWTNVDSDAEDSFGLSDLAEVLPEAKRLQPAAFIEFGNGPDYFCLSFFQDHTVILYQLDKEKDEYVSVASAFVNMSKGDGTPCYIYVYPYGASLYLFPETAIPDGPGVIEAQQLKLDRSVQLGEGKMLVTLYGGAVDFGFCPVTHAWAGYIEGPDVMIPFPPETFEDNEGWGLVQCVWHGKCGASAYNSGERLSPPDDDDDHPEEVEYLQNTYIKLTLYERYIKDDGSPMTDAEVETGEIQRLITFYNGLLRGGNDEGYVLVNEDESISEDNEVPLDDVIYSPGVTVFGVTYTPGDIDVHMPASPQISKNDTVHVSVMQSVEQSQAEVTLNNRKPRGQGGSPDITDNDMRPLGRGELPESENLPVVVGPPLLYANPIGKYTHRKGDENTGVKPIRVRARVLDTTVEIATNADADPVKYALEAEALEEVIAHAEAGFNAERLGEYKDALNNLLAEGEDLRGFVPGLPERQLFWGYVSRRTNTRSSPGNESWATFNCEDRTKQLRETFCFNVPIMDGFCHLAAMYVLAKESGFADEDIVLWQNPHCSPGEENDPKNKILLLDEINRVSGENSQLTRKSGCWKGHTEGSPNGQSINGRNIEGERLHMCLPLCHLSGEAPFYDFKTGTVIYEAMQKIRQHSFWYLFCNNWGNFQYVPDDAARTSTGQTFVEVDSVGAYNEYQQSLTTIQDSSTMAEGVYVIGVLLKRIVDAFPSGQPEVNVRTQDNWPHNTKSPAFFPYRKIFLMRNPKWNDPARNKFIAESTFVKVTSEKMAVDTRIWGRPGIFPYDVIAFDESHANETGVSVVPGRKFILNQVRHEFSAQGGSQLTWWTNLAAELYVEIPKSSAPEAKPEMAEYETFVTNGPVSIGNAQKVGN